MDELVKQVSERTGISHDQAHQAVQMVVSFMKDKLPPPVAAQIDGLLGNPMAGGAVGQAMDALGGMFGKKE